jgi:hypothetical protein
LGRDIFRIPRVSPHDGDYDATFPAGEGMSLRRNVFDLMVFLSRSADRGRTDEYRMASDRLLDGYPDSGGWTADPANSIVLW